MTRLQIIAFAVCAGLGGCSHASHTQPPESHLEPEPPSETTGPPYKVPPSFSTGPLEFARDPGLYPQPHVVASGNFETEKRGVSRTHALFTNESSWIAVELSSGEVTQSGSFEHDGVLEIEGVVGHVARVKTGPLKDDSNSEKSEALLFDFYSRRSRGDTRDVETKGLDLETGKWVPAPVLEEPTRKLERQYEDRATQTCSRIEDGEVVWTIDCSRAAEPIDFVEDLVLLSRAVKVDGETRSYIFAHAWEDGALMWKTLTGVKRDKKSVVTLGTADDITFVAGNADALWYEGPRNAPSAILVLDAQSGELKNVIGNDFFPTHGSNPDPSRVVYSSSSQWAILDLTQTHPPTRTQRTLAEDVEEWIDIVSKSDERTRESDRAISKVLQVATFDPHLVGSALTKDLDLFWTLADRLPLEAIRPHLDVLVNDLKTTQVKSSGGRHPELMEAALRRTFGEPPTDRWIEIRLYALQHIRGPSFSDALTATVQETIPWIEELSTLYVRRNHLLDREAETTIMTIVRRLERSFGLGLIHEETFEPLWAALRGHPRPEPCTSSEECVFEPPVKDDRLWVVRDASGTIALWHGRSRSLVRDFLISRKIDGKWSPPMPLGLPNERRFPDEIRSVDGGVKLSDSFSEKDFTLTWAELEADTDSDGWTDITEALLGTDPARADSDSDGTPDPLDPAPRCARKTATTPEQRIMARFISLAPREDSLPEYFGIDLNHCVQPSPLRTNVFFVDKETARNLASKFEDDLDADRFHILEIKEMTEDTLLRLKQYRSPLISEFFDGEDWKLSQLLVLERKSAKDEGAAGEHLVFIESQGNWIPLATELATRSESKGSASVR